MPTPHSARGSDAAIVEARTDGTLIRKTSLQDRSDDSAVKHKPTKHRALILRSARTCRECVPAAILRLTIDTRNDLLFTMSDITRLSQSRETRASRVHNATKHEFVCLDEPDPTGGARRDRTDDLLLAKQALSQLSYGPWSQLASQPLRHLRAI